MMVFIKDSNFELLQVVLELQHLEASLLSLIRSIDMAGFDGYDAYGYMSQDGYPPFPYTQSLEDSFSEEIPSSQPSILPPPLLHFPIRSPTLPQRPIARRSPIPPVFAPPAHSCPPILQSTENAQSLNPTEDVPEPSQKKRARRKTKDTGKTPAGDVKRGRSTNWKDNWVVGLIRLRGEMHNEFLTKAGKQGVDIWQKLYLQLVSLCPELDKDSEACRKKWQAVYGDYKTDKAQNNISGAERSEKCKWYDLIDQYMSQRAHVVCYSHDSAIDGNTPMAENEDEIEVPEEEDGEKNQTSKDKESVEKKNTPNEKDNEKEKRKKKPKGAASEVALAIKRMTDISQKAQDDNLALEKEKLDMLKGISQSLQGLFEKIN